MLFGYYLAHMASWVYSGPEGSDSATGDTTTSQNRARPCKNARGPPKVRLSVPQSSRGMSRAIGRDLASIEVLKLFLRHFQNSRPNSKIWKIFKNGKSILKNQTEFFRKIYFSNGNPIQNRWSRPNLPACHPLSDFHDPKISGLLF